jgi:AcrR family transcriptional regulator
MIPATFTHRGVPVTSSVAALLGESAIVVSFGSFSRRGPIYQTFCRGMVMVSLSFRILPVVPKLWSKTIDAHRREVSDAILDTTAAVVAEHGLLAVTMSQIAEETGIGRATLYKYFPDVEAILLAWHERQISMHLEYLVQVRDQAGDAGRRLKAVLDAYALISHESHGHHDRELAGFLHRDEQVARAQQQLRGMIRDLVAEGAEAGKLRDDVSPDELASYCLHALTAASNLPSKAAVRRLVTVTLAGLRPSGSH